MDDILKLSNAIFSLIGWAYIMFKAGGWIADTFAKQWCKRRKDTVRQKALTHYTTPTSLEILSQEQRLDWPPKTG